MIWFGLNLAAGVFSTIIFFKEDKAFYAFLWMVAAVLNFIGAGVHLEEMVNDAVDRATSAIKAVQSESTSGLDI